MIRLALVSLLVVCAYSCALAQQPNPVDRKVANPMTDTPNVNPLNNDQPVQRKQPAQNGVTGTATDELSVESTRQSVSGPEDARIFHYEGNVDARIGTYRLQADKITVYDAENKIVAEGSVDFDQADLQRITGSRGEWNYRT